MRIVLAACGLAGLSAAGCFGTTEHALRKEANAPVQIQPAQTWPVTAEQINDRNAHQMTQALLDELDREELQGTKKMK